MAIINIENSLLKLVNLNTNEDSIYIMENKYAEEIVLNRGLVGLDFANACYMGSKFFVSHFADELENIDDIAELMLLSKGFYYRLFDAYAEVMKKIYRLIFLQPKE